MTRVAGKIKWVRHDGCGYIEVNKQSYLFDYSCTALDIPNLTKGASVTFMPKLVLGRLVATDVRLG